MMPMAGFTLGRGIIRARLTQRRRATPLRLLDSVSLFRRARCSRGSHNQAHVFRSRVICTHDVFPRLGRRRHHGILVPTTVFWRIVMSPQRLSARKSARIACLTEAIFRAHSSSLP